MSQVQQIKEATNIIDVIGERLELQRAGGHHKACCPFHSEKSPSFFVSESMQRFKCFGCGETGDVITFLEKYETMTFFEALEYLADKAGIILQKTTRSALSTQEQDEQKSIIEILTLAKEYYHYVLTEHSAGQAARTYVTGRNIHATSISLFEIGYSLPEWDGLYTYLHKKKGYSTELLLKAGLIIQGKKGGYYDRFRDRIMFPLKNHRGQVVGFSGRVLDPTIKEAKYINSPETAVYHKSKMLFGYAELLQSIRAKKTVVIVEGELDVIASNQAHVPIAVAVKGSALTQDHAQLIKRVAQKVIVSMDTDSAGVEATKRAIKVLSPYDLEVRVASLPQGKDPDELVKKDPALWREAVKHTQSVYAFLIDQSIRAHGSASGEEKRKVMQEVAPVLAQMSHAVEQDFYIRYLAEHIHVREEVVREDIRRAAQLGEEKYTKMHEKVTQAVSQSNNTQKQKSKSPSRKMRLERYLAFLFFALCMPPYDKLQTKHFSQVQDDLQTLLQYQWEDYTVADILKNVMQLASNQSPLTLDYIATKLPQDHQDLVMQIAYQPKAISQLEHADLIDEWHTITKQLMQICTTAKIKEVSKKLQELDTLDELSEEQEALQKKLLQEVIELNRRVK